jgi:nucleoside phosphorylase
MVGIAGGVEGAVQRGDVVVADYIFYYEMAKLTSAGEQRRAQQFRTDRLLYGRAESYEQSDWKSDLDRLVPDGEEISARVPEAHFGPIASGEKVVANKAALQELIDDCPKLLAVAMEGAGVARATTLATYQPRFLEIRGISDFADQTKDDAWRRIAADAAAAFTIGLLRTRPVPPLHKSEADQAQAAPLLIIREESLRQVGATEILPVLADEIGGRDIETVQLDFTDLVQGGVLTDPQVAVTRLMDRNGPLWGALARRADSEIVFHGLAHIPLLVFTGHLVSDRQPVRLFDFHPSGADGAGSWVWPSNGGGHPPLNVRGMPKSSPRRRGDVVVRVAISYRPQPAQTALIVPDPIFAVDLQVPEPQRGVVTSEAQVRAYGRVFRQVMDEIARFAVTVDRVHLFYAGPVALGFHIGQQISENIHPAVVAWNFHRVYDWAIDLAAASIGEPSIVRPQE